MGSKMDVEKFVQLRDKLDKLISEYNKKVEIYDSRLFYDNFTINSPIKLLVGPLERQKFGEIEYRIAKKVAEKCGVNLEEYTFFLNNPYKLDESRDVFTTPAEEKNIEDAIEKLCRSRIELSRAFKEVADKLYK